ncbi:LacI family DNA-binding transcriptional regulator [Halanaerobium saccharolyticum]|uniref:LacI family DNA-binding transcriptional regulator n=1 Tax=Halanaerobium saccharolyticum TaxID=43595 RepID=UPI003FCD4656
MTNINDVAKLAGVSKSTVSRVLNNKDIVQPDTRDKVIDAMEKLNYKPDMNARYLRRDETKLIALVMPDISDPFYDQLAAVVEDEADNNNYNVILFNETDKENFIEKTIRILQQRRVDGLVYISENLSDKYYNILSECEFPVVQFTNFQKSGSFPSAGIDFYQAVYEMNAYLLQEHKNIVFFNSYQNKHLKKLMRKAFLESHKDNGFKVQEDQIIELDREQDLDKSFVQILNSKEKIDAVFVSNDEIAIKLMNYLQKNGIQIPEDISVAGFNNIRYSNFTNPRLTTISHPLEQIGIKLADILIDLINQKELKTKDTIFKHQIIIRESTK